MILGKLIITGFVLKNDVRLDFLIVIQGFCRFKTTRKKCTGSRYFAFKLYSFV